MKNPLYSHFRVSDAIKITAALAKLGSRARPDKVFCRHCSEPKSIKKKSYGSNLRRHLQYVHM